MRIEQKSIREILQQVNLNMFLPEIQRDFVWKPSQIEALFDSIVLGYPIGTLLFWKTSKEAIQKNGCPLYKFICNYHERDKKENEKAPEQIISNYPFYYIVVDGQQRISSLFIGLLGSMSLRVKYKWRTSDDAYPKTELYYNLDCDYSDSENDDSMPATKFKFFSNNDVPNDHFWFKVSDVIGFDDPNDNKFKEYSKANGLSPLQEQNLEKLYKAVNAKGDEAVISYYCIEEVSYDDVLNIFVRLNSSGTYLSKTDLLFSKIVSGWSGGKEKIEELIKSINGKGKGFCFSKNNIMRACLVFSGQPVQLKIESFGDKGVTSIREDFQKISEAIHKMTNALVKIGYSKENLTSYNATIPIAYYFYKGGIESQETENGIRQYLAVALLKGLFGVASNSALSSTRSCLGSTDCPNKEFSVGLFREVILTNGANFTFSEKDIDKCFEYPKGPKTFFLLTLLYPNISLNQVEWHQDHVHPYAGFSKTKLKRIGTSDQDIEEWERKRNTLPNLQLLEGVENETKNKTPLIDWVKMDPIHHNFDYRPTGVLLDIREFNLFYSKREKLMKERLMEIFGLKA